MLRHPISKKDKKSLLQEISRLYSFLNLDYDQPFEHGRDDEGEYLILGRDIVLFKTGSKWIPSLKYIIKNNIKPSPVLYVDRGAVNALLRGADLMAPGVRGVEGSFNRDDVVFILDEEAKKPIALGLALYSSSELKTVSRGRVVKIIHHVGDRFYNKTV
jgi:PUA domain protein